MLKIEILRWKNLFCLKFLCCKKQHQVEIYNWMDISMIPYALNSGVEDAKHFYGGTTINLLQFYDDIAMGANSIDDNGDPWRS